MTTALLDAVTLARSGRLDEALDELRHPPGPDDPAAAHALRARLALAANKPVEAEGAANLAIRAGAGVPARLSLVNALRRQRRYDDAQQALAQALRHDPEHPHLHLERAALAHALRDPREARRCALRALALDDSLIDAERLLARLDLEGGARTAAASRLKRLLARDLSPDRRGPIGLDLARILDRLGQTDEAWVALSAAQRDRRQSPAFRNISPTRWPDLAAAVARWCRSGAVDTAPPPIFPDPPVFVVGVPRSGTTLLEQMLDAHPALTSLDERPVLQLLLARIPHLLGRPFAYPADLPTLTIAERATLIEAWVHLVQPLRTGPGTIVDKMPLNLPWLPLAWTLFPDAAMILAVRDPRDSLISGLFQDLEANEAMWHLADPTTSARLADRTFDLWDALGGLPGFRAIEQRYEDLVAEPETTLRRLFARLDRPYDPAMLTWYTQSERKPISTPSRQAVSRPLTRKPIGRWRRYEAQLKPVQPILARWVERFGYDPASTRPG